MPTAIITAVGAATSVGFDAATTCASIRAGLSRPSVLNEFQVLDLKEQMPTGLMGHPMGAVTLGFSNVGRWLQMAKLAVEDLCQSAELPGVEQKRFWSSTWCYLVTPVLDVPRFIVDGACASEATLQAKFARPLAVAVKSRFAPAKFMIQAGGRVAALSTIVSAQELFRRGDAERVVVVAVDSLTDRAGLSWLDELGRLKQDTNPVGLMPGEGAVAFMLEDSRVAQTRGAAGIACPAGVSTGKDPRAFRFGGKSIGLGLARVVQGALEASGFPLPYSGRPITDLNGEKWRSVEYGHAQTRVSRDIWASRGVTVPAMSVGDIGAGMTALQVVMACRAFARNYAFAGHVLLTASDEYGNVGAAVLSGEA